MKKVTVVLLVGILIPLVGIVNLSSAHENVNQESVPPFELWPLTDGWIRNIYPEDQMIEVITRYELFGDPWTFLLHVTDSTQIKIDGKSADFVNLEPNQYITYSFYDINWVLYADRISAKTHGKPPPD